MTINKAKVMLMIILNLSSKNEDSMLAIPSLVTT